MVLCFSFVVSTASVYIYLGLRATPNFSELYSSNDFMGLRILDSEVATNKTLLTIMTGSVGQWEILPNAPQGVGSNNGHRIEAMGDYVYFTPANGSSSFYRYSYAGGWQTLPSAPTGSSYGIGLVRAKDPAGNPAIYIIAGTTSSITGWYRYTDAGGWSASLSTSIPWGGSGLQQNCSKPANGSEFCWDGEDTIYYFPGSGYSYNRYDWYKYTISTGYWYYMGEFNTSGDPKNGPGNAACLVTIGAEKYIYIQFGHTPSGNYTSAQFWRYKISNGTWEKLAQHGYGADDGSDLVWDGGDYIYHSPGAYAEGLPATEETRFFRYSISGHNWVAMESQPYNAAGGSDDGGSSAIVGDYIYRLKGGDGNGDGYSSIFYRYSMSYNNNPPSLSSGSVSPNSGNPDATFTYGVTYTDADGDTPPYVYVYVDGSAKTMTKISGAYSSGTLYQYTTTLSVGSHTYYFETSDGQATARLPASGSYNGPSVTAPSNPPSLSSGGVSPASGSPSSMFTYVVTYTDVDDNAPSYVYINVDGLQHSMSKVSGTYTGGAIYSYTAFNLDVGLHEYYFETSDGQATARLPASGSYDGPNVIPPNNPPSLSSGSVSPSSGRIDTTSTYEVTYTDADGDAPSYIKVYIDGASYQMSEISGAYTDGAIYHSTTTLGIGSHTYYFEASDGQATARLPTSGNSSGPIVGLALTTISIFPSSFTLPSGNSITLTAVLEDENNNKLSGKTITWSDNAGAFSTTSGSTDSLGQVSVTYTAPSVTTQASTAISASFASDDKYGASSGISSGTIVPPGATILSISPSTFTLYPGYSGQIQTLVATLKDAINNALANETITWSATSGNLSSSSDTTDTSGQVSVTYTAPAVTAQTSVTITASFAGDDQYEASSGTSLGIPAVPISENIPASTGGTVVVNVIEINVTMNLLVVPPNALSKNTTIDVIQKLPENLPTYVMVSDIFDIGPNGTTFNKPSTLTLPYNENEIPPGMSENDLAIYRRIDGGDNWELVGGNVDKATNTISVQINHLSEYAVMASIGNSAAVSGEIPWLTIGAITAILAIVVIALLIKRKEKWWVKEEKKTKWR